MEPKCRMIAFLRVGPTPGTSSKIDAVMALPRNSRWNVMANR